MTELAAPFSIPPGFIDVHTHHTPPEYVALLGELAAGNDATAESARFALSVLEGYGDACFTDVNLREPGLDAAGISHQVLSFIGPAVVGDEAVQTRLADTYNRALAALCDGRPERYSFLARVPQLAEDAARRSYCEARAMGAVGVGLTLRADGAWFDEAACRPLLAELSADHALVLLHPTGTLGAPCGWTAAAWPVGAVFEDVMALLLMLRDGVLARWSGIRWVFPHLGGVLPFVRTRLQQAAGLLEVDVDALDALDNVFYDTANPQPSAVSLALEVMGAARLVLGTDFPYAQRPLGLGATRDLLEGAGLSSDELERVGWSTAAGLLTTTAGWPQRGRAGTRVDHDVAR